MELINPSPEQALIAEKQELAHSFASRIDAVVGKTADVGELPSWDLSFPAKDGHPGLGLLGVEGYGMLPGKLEISTLADGYALTLWATGDQKLGRPHSMQSNDAELNIHDSLYDGLQVVIRPDSDIPLLFNWIIKDWRQQEFLGIWPKHVRLFTDVCIDQAEIKTGLKPRPSRQLVAAAAVNAAFQGHRQGKGL